MILDSLAGGRGRGFKTFKTFHNSLNGIHKFPAYFP